MVINEDDNSSCCNNSCCEVIKVSSNANMSSLSSNELDEEPSMLNNSISALIESQPSPTSAHSKPKSKSPSLTGLRPNKPILPSPVGANSTNPILNQLTSINTGSGLSLNQIASRSANMLLSNSNVIHTSAKKRLLSQANENSAGFGSIISPRMQLESLASALNGNLSALVQSSANGVTKCINNNSNSNSNNNMFYVGSQQPVVTPNSQQAGILQ